MPGAGDEHELEDDIEENGRPGQQVLEDDLEDDVDADYRQQGAGLEDEDAQAGPGPSTASTAADRKARLQQLAGLVRKRGKEQADDGGKKKKPKGREAKDGGEKAGRGKARNTARPVRERRPAPEEEGGEPAAAGRVPRGGGEALGNEEEVASEELHEVEEDLAFIDDEGVEAASGGGEDDEAHIDAAPEAEEGDEIDDLLNRKKRRRERDHSSVHDEVVQMLGKMEVAFEEDWECMCKNQGFLLARNGEGGLVKEADGFKVASKGPPPAQKVPAVNKLKMLTDMEGFLAQRKYHEMFIARGGLGLLKGWLEPYPDGSLPNVRVRTAVLRVLSSLPVDTRMEDMKELLKRSQLGRNVMFLYKCSEETADNRRLAKELVHKWARPIFYDQDAEEAKKRLNERLLVEARKQSQALRVKQDAEKSGMEATRQKAVRIHALIPQGSKLDYVVNPQKSNEISAAAEVTQARSGVRSDDSLSKKLREQQRKLKASSARAMVPSVEGRNIVLMDSR